MRTAAHPRGDEARDRSAQRRSGQNRRASENPSARAWRLVDDFPLYEVSSDGLVRNRKTKRLLARWKTSNGYLAVTFFRDGKNINQRVHRLVASAFISNPDRKTEVNHIDFDRTNNELSNLEWCTSLENQKHYVDAVASGLRKRNRGGSPRKIQDHEIPEIFLFRNAGESFAQIAKRFGVSAPTIRSIYIGETYVGS